MPDTPLLLEGFHQMLTVLKWENALDHETDCAGGRRFNSCRRDGLRTEMQLSCSNAMHVRTGVEPMTACSWLF